MLAVVESHPIQPKAVQSAANAVALVVRQRAAVFEVGLPSLERVQVRPFLRYFAYSDNLLEQRERYGDFADEVRRLACIMCQELHCIMERTVVLFCGCSENADFLAVEDVAVAATGGCESESVVDGVGGGEDVGYEFGS